LRGRCGLVALGTYCRNGAASRRAKFSPRT
jgi:hypothetical protein